MKGWLRLKGLNVAAFLLVMVLRIWFFTLRRVEHGREYKEETENAGLPIVVTTWHYAILGMPLYRSKLQFAMMVSSSRDGDFVAAVVEQLGFSAVRGSSNRKGVVAAKEIIREMRAGRSSGLVADGSQGPARVAQAGPVLLAAKSGKIVFPMLWSASSYFSFNTWDRLSIPRPFSKIEIVYGKPLYLPDGLKANQLEEYRLQLEERLNGIYNKAWKLQGKESH